jgi:hypothetical protein
MALSRVDLVGEYKLRWINFTMSWVRASWMVKLICGFSVVALCLGMYSWWGWRAQRPLVWHGPVSIGHLLYEEIVIDWTKSLIWTYVSILASMIDFKSLSQEFRIASKVQVKFSWLNLKPRL